MYLDRWYHFFHSYSYLSGKQLKSSNEVDFSEDFLVQCSNELSIGLKASEFLFLAESRRIAAFRVIAIIVSDKILEKTFQFGEFWAPTLSTSNSIDHDAQVCDIQDFVEQS